MSTAVSGTLADNGLRDQTPGVKSIFVKGFEWFGELGIFSARVFRALRRLPYEFGELLRQCDAIGAKSLPLVALAGAATGVVLSLQTHDALIRFGSQVPASRSDRISIIKESGPVITGLVVAGRVGAGIGAELGSMNVTEQIDAMEASAVDPYRFLGPRRAFLACVLMLSSADAGGGFQRTYHGWLANTLTDSISFRLFIESGFQDVLFSDFIPPTLKTAVFGLIIGIVACFRECEPREARRASADPRPARWCCRLCL